MGLLKKIGELIYRPSVEQSIEGPNPIDKNLPLAKEDIIDMAEPELPIVNDPKSTEVKTIPKTTEKRELNLIPKPMNYPSVDEIRDKNTHYVLIFGYVGSGKTTLLAMVNLFLRREYKIVINASQKNKEAIVYINKIVGDLKDKRFPDSTRETLLIEFDVAIQLPDGRFLNFTFIEVSGEDIRKLKAENNGKLPDFINYYLSIKEISISYIMVADHNQILKRKEKDSDQDELMHEFISHLIHYQANISNLALIISKCDREIIKSSKENELYLAKILEEKMPQTYKWLKDRNQMPNSVIIPFSIGRVKKSENGKDMIEELILSDSQNVVNWLFDTHGENRGAKKKWWHK